MRVFMLVLLGWLSGPHACLGGERAAASDAPIRELFLAGGALGVCSDLAPRACAAPAAGARGPARYRLDEAGIERALAPALWSAPGAPPTAAVGAMLRQARSAPGTQAENANGLDAAALERALSAACLAATCADPDARRPWSVLLDVERSAVLAALELPAVGTDGTRPREQVRPAASRIDGGVQVLQAFVAAAKRRGGARPRIAVVTASAFDPMEPVDFYLALFEALGAEAQWWPVDAAVAAARFEVRDCDALPRLRLERLRLAQRERIYPDLAAVQRAFCEASTALPPVDGVFFAGGDQWRMRRAFFDADDRANPWLAALQRSHAAGTVVVGGTSAGAAVQSGAWMLGNGSVEAAIARPVRSAAPPEPGCARGKRCGDAGEDQLTLWSGGGLGLATGAIVDTHFSERARELRLLQAMRAADARWAYGADEASALHVRDAGTRREITALGEHGGWVLQRRASEPHAATAWYLVAGATLVIEGDEVQLKIDEDASPARRPQPQSFTSAFEPGALRHLAQQFAWRCGKPLELHAGSAVAQLRCMPGQQSWGSPKGLNGIGPLALVLQRQASALVPASTTQRAGTTSVTP